MRISKLTDTIDEDRGADKVTDPGPNRTLESLFLKKNGYIDFVPFDKRRPNGDPFCTSQEVAFMLASLYDLNGDADAARASISTTIDSGDRSESSARLKTLIEER